jgi:hypothetical protein
MPAKKAMGMMKKPCMVAPKVKPPTMSDADWARELARCAVVAADRNRRDHIQHQADAELTKSASFASYTASQGDSGGEGFFSDSAPAVARSGTNGGRIYSPRLTLSRMLPEFGESKTYPRTIDGGFFSLVTAARQDGIHVDLNLSYTAFASSDMRHVPNKLVGSSSDATHALFDGMLDTPMRCSAICPVLTRFSPTRRVQTS